AYYSDGSSQDVTSSASYSSSNTSVATVSSSGLVTAVEVGSATVTVSYGGKSAGVPVTVTVPAIISQISVREGFLRTVNGRSVWFVRSDMVTLELAFSGEGPFEVRHDPGGGIWYDWRQVPGPTASLAVVLTKFQGANCARVEARNGQAAEVRELTIVVDPVPPGVKRLRGLNGATAASQPWAQLEIEAEDNLPYGLEYRFRVNNGAWSSWCSLDDDVFSVSGLVSGANRIAVEVRDAAGNTSKSAATLFGIF
ncbi:MAG: Ig-like domain-containing protein, partial [Moorellales bacterium]